MSENNNLVRTLQFRVISGTGALIPTAQNGPARPICHLVGALVFLFIFPLVLINRISILFMLFFLFYFLCLYNFSILCLFPVLFFILNKCLCCATNHSKNKGILKNHSNKRNILIEKYLH